MYIRATLEQHIPLVTGRRRMRGKRILGLTWLTPCVALRVTDSFLKISDLNRGSTTDKCAASASISFYSASILQSKLGSIRRIQQDLRR